MNAKFLDVRLSRVFQFCTSVRVPPAHFTSIFRKTAFGCSAKIKRKEESKRMISVTITKTRGQRLGVSLEEDSSGRIFVTRVSPTGVFAGSELKAGCEILMVNSIPCDGLRLKDVSKIMVESEGIMTVHALSSVEGGDVEDDNNDDEYDDVEQQPRGSTHDNNENENENSNPPATPSPSRQEPGAVEVLLDPRRAPPPEPVPLKKSRSKNRSFGCGSSFGRQNRKAGEELGESITITVPHAPRLGLRLQESLDGPYVFVRRIDPDSVFANTEMRVGMKLLAINDYDAVGLNIEDLTNLLRQPPPDGLLTVMGAFDKDYDVKALKEEAHELRSQQGTPEDLQERFQRYKSARQKQKNPSIVRASAFKQASSQSTGLRLKETPDKRHVRIDIIQPNSPFVNTDLEVGMRLLSINGVSCSGMTVKQVANLFRETRGYVTVEAKHSG